MEEWNNKFNYKSVAVGIIVLVILGGLWFGLGREITENPVLKLGLIPAEDQVKMLKQFQPTVKYLEESTGMKVEAFVATDYTGVVEALKAGKIDVAYLGPFAYILAESQDPTIEPFAVGVRTSSGLTTYKSIIVAGKNSGIKSIADLKANAKDINFAFVDPASTSGHLMPKGYLLSQGIDPANFKNLMFAGGHDAVELAIKNGKVQAGADSDVTYGPMVEKGVISKEENIIIWTSDPIPGSPLVYKSTLPESTKEKIRNVFYKMHEAKNANEVLGGYGAISKYVPASKEDYQPVRQAAVNLGMIK
ncbi:MAG: phosphonate ABC transporter substrate-binding protein [Euryarchaeota archaeon]|nr:phosphonate ABC transporter substrate-binding protein [Euryarchaeota archaeon]